MASLRDRPYAQFNFLVDLGTELGDGPHAGFQEVSGLKKITGLNKSTDVTLKSGVIGALALQDWLDQIRSGNKQANRTVTIMVQDEANKIAQTWQVLHARPRQ